MRIAAKAEKTEWQNDNSPAWPISMLYDSAKMIIMPVWLSIDTTKPAWRAMLPVVEQPGQHDRDCGGGEPGPPADAARGGRRAGRTRTSVLRRVAHVSRVPISPRGRNTRIRISSA